MSTPPHDDAWLMLGLYANDGERSVIEAVLARIPEDDRYPYDGPRETLDEFGEWFDQTDHAIHTTRFGLTSAMALSMDEVITAYRASRAEEWAAWRTR